MARLSAGWRVYPDWQAAKIGQLQGESVDINGGDPNAAMRSQRDCGYCEYGAIAYPLSLERNTVENTGMDAYSPELDARAREDRVAGFVTVDGPNDLATNICAALTMAYDPSARLGATVQVFAKWYGDWYPKNGYIPTGYDTTRFGYHHWIFIDFFWEDGRRYLVAHNSGGTGIGDQGFFYFPDEVVNREGWGSVWGTTIKIVKPLTQAEIDLGKQETPAGLIQRQIYAIWYAISEYIISLRA